MTCWLVNKDSTSKRAQKIKKGTRKWNNCPWEASVSVDFVTTTSATVCNVASDITKPLNQPQRLVVLHRHNGHLSDETLGKNMQTTWHLQTAFQIWVAEASPEILKCRFQANHLFRPHRVLLFLWVGDLPTPSCLGPQHHHQKQEHQQNHSHGIRDSRGASALHSQLQLH